MLPLPLRFIIAMVAYAINKQMARRIEYLMEEVCVLREVYTETTAGNASCSPTNNGVGWPSRARP
jgi:hypothetical protein